MNWITNQIAPAMDASIGAFEARAQLSRLLRAVEQSERFTSTVRGRPVADLVPHRAEVASFVSEGRM